MKITTLINFVSLLMMSTPAYGTPSVDPSRSYTYEPEITGCRQQRNLPWCSGKIPNGDTLSIEHIKRSTNITLRGFNYTPQRQADRIWRSYREEINYGREWNGNCDNLVYTSLDILSRMNVNMQNVFRALVRTQASVGETDHMIALAEINGAYVVFADGTRIEPYPLSEAKWSLVRISPINSTKWFDVVSSR